MSLFVQRSLFLLFLTLVIPLGSGQVLADDKEVVLAAPAEIPPFYTKDGKGIIPDLMNAVLGPKGYKITVKSMGNIRITRSLKSGKVDIAPFAVEEVTDVHFSQNKYLTFLNVVIIKKSKNVEIKSLADLKGLRIAAFQGAKNVFGKEYTQIVDNDALSYKEMSDQKRQMDVFWRDRVDAVILGKKIFDYRSFVIGNTQYSPDDVAYHYLFGEGTSFAAVFADEKIRDDFDDGYNALVKNNKLDDIYKPYVLAAGS